MPDVKQPLTDAPITDSVETVYAGRLLAVRVETVEQDDGRLSRREIVSHPGSVGVLPLTTDGRVVLVRQYRPAIGDCLLEIPAGLIDANEEPEIAARRELLEETGCEARRCDLIGTFWLSPGYSTEACHLFVAAECRCSDLLTSREPGLRLEVLAVNAISELLSAGRPVVADAKTMIALQWLLLQRAHRLPFA